SPRWRVRESARLIIRQRSLVLRWALPRSITSSRENSGLLGIRVARSPADNPRSRINVDGQKLRFPCAIDLSRNLSVDFHGERRRSATHQSTSPDLSFHYSKLC